jgi:signal transduction histidine kinase
MTIDKRKHFNAKQREDIGAIFEQLPIPVHYWKKIGDDFIFWGYNKANDKLAGNILKDSIGKKASVIHSNEPHLLDLLKKCYNEKKELFLETKYRFKESEQEKNLRGHYKFVPPDYVVIATLDITKEKYFEQKLKEFNKSLEEKVNKLEQSERKYKKAFNRANFYKDLFAHDINNFLQNIRSASELIDMELSDIKDKEYVDEWINIMQDQINKAAKLISNVQKISELEESETVLHEVDLCRLLNKSIDSLRSMYEGSLSEIGIDSYQEDIFVKANDLLEDVFDNLLINAVKHTDKDSIKIKIQITRKVLNDKQFISVSVIDNGKGIKDSRKENIFQKGYGRSSGKQGKGLGLYLVDKIIKSYGGKIWVENRVKGDYSKGTKFIMLIPAP